MLALLFTWLCTGLQSWFDFNEAVICSVISTMSSIMLHPESQMQLGITLSLHTTAQDEHTLHKRHRLPRHSSAGSVEG